MLKSKALLGVRIILLMSVVPLRSEPTAIGLSTAGPTNLEQSLLMAKIIPLRPSMVSTTRRLSIRMSSMASDIRSISRTLIRRRNPLWRERLRHIVMTMFVVL